MTVTEVERTAAEPPVVEPGQLDEETRDVLRRAKGLVAKAWGQGDGYMPPFEGHCVITAISAAIGGPFDTCPAQLHLRGILGEDLIEWNDAPGRTQAEVVALFDRALTTSDREAVAP
jgi:hypothetical protein